MAAGKAWAVVAVHKRAISEVAVAGGKQAPMQAACMAEVSHSGSCWFCSSYSLLQGRSYGAAAVVEPASMTLDKKLGAVGAPVVAAADAVAVAVENVEMIVRWHLRFYFSETVDNLNKSLNILYNGLAEIPAGAVAQSM